MRDSGVPEARGAIQPARCRLAGWMSLSVLALLALGPWPLSPRQDRALAATGSAQAEPRRLQAASAEARPNFETAAGRLDCLDPDTFTCKITSKELTS